jgi:hypothetical protein
MKGTCIRCGKPFNSVDDIHTCTPPRALMLANELETKGEALGCSFDRHSAELRSLHAEVEMQFQALKAARQLMESYYQSAKKDEALLRQALEALERTTPMGFNMESDKKFYAAIAALRERLNLTKGS